MKIVYTRNCAVGGVYHAKGEVGELDGRKLTETVDAGKCTEATPENVAKYAPAGRATKTAGTADDGGDKKPAADGGDKKPAADGGDKKPAAGGGDKKPAADGGDKKPAADGGDKKSK